MKKYMSGLNIMMPIQKTDFISIDGLGKILQCHRLRDKKYGSPNYRRVSIRLRSSLPTRMPNVFYASAMFLKMLFEKYGDISFENALNLWEESK